MGFDYWSIRECLGADNDDMYLVDSAILLRNFVSRLLSGLLFLV